MTWEFDFLNYIAQFHSKILNTIMIAVSSVNNNGYICIGITLLLLCSKKYRLAGITCALALVIMQISGNIIVKNIINRPRPYEIHNVALLISMPKGSSFPSGHTYSSFATATAIFMWHKKWGIVFFALAALIGFSRLYLYVHFPTDVIAAIFLGIVDGLISCLIVKRLLLKGKWRCFD